MEMGTKCLLGGLHATFTALASQTAFLSLRLLKSEAQWYAYLEKERNIAQYGLRLDAPRHGLISTNEDD